MPAQIAGKTAKEALVMAEELLVKLGLSERLHHRPSRLSGGEKQRVAIGRALINRPLCLLMDEPTGNLDPKTAESVMTLMRDVVFEDTGFVIVTHDPVIAQSTDRQYELSNGRLIERV